MSELSALGAFVRRHDPDRFLATLFAPAERRETLFALYAFAHEIGRAWEVTSQPTLALIRLQWWREVLEGADRRHEVARPLMAEVAAGRLGRAELLGLLDGVESIERGFATTLDWQTYLRATAGELAAVAGRALGGAPPWLDRLGALGAAYGAAAQLRSGRIWGGTVPARPAETFTEELAGWARALLGPRRPLPRGLIAAGLVGALARRDLRDPAARRLRGLGDRAAVMLAAARSRV